MSDEKPSNVIELPNAGAGRKAVLFAAQVRRQIADGWPEPSRETLEENLESDCCPECDAEIRLDPSDPEVIRCSDGGDCEWTQAVADYLGETA